MNINNISSLIESGIGMNKLPISKSRLKSFIDKWYIHSSEQMVDWWITLFGAILLLLMDELLQLGFSQKLLQAIYREYYSDSLHIQAIKFSDGVELYNFPLVIPVLMTLSERKYYLIVSGEWELTFENEEDLVARISFSDATGDSIHGRILLDIEVFLSRLGIKSDNHSKWTLKKIWKILTDNRITFLEWGKYYYERKYYDKPSSLEDTIGNVARVPNRMTLLKSNDKGSITHISISTRIEL